MTLEISKETKVSDGTWYTLRADGTIIDCSRKLEELEETYEKIKKDPTLIKGSITILKSEEI